MAGSGEIVSSEEEDTPAVAARPTNGSGAAAADDDNGSVRSTRSTRSATKSKAKAAQSQKKRRRKEDNGNDEDSDDNDNGNNNMEDDGDVATKKPKKKRSRLKSPAPPKGKSGKAAQSKDDDDDDEDSEMEEEDETKPSPDEVAAADAKPPAAKRGAAKKTPLPKLQIPAHQTPGKHKRGTASRQPESTSNASANATSEIAVPNRKLLGIKGSTPTAAASQGAGTVTTQSPVPTNQNQDTPTDGLGNNADGTPRNDAPQQEQQPQAPPTDGFFSLSNFLVWSLLFLSLHVCVCYFAGDSIPGSMTVANLSDSLVHFYKGTGYSIGLMTPPIKTIPNMTRVAEIKELEQRRQQQKRKMLKDLEDARKAMEREIQAMKDDTGDMTKHLDSIEEQVNGHKEPVAKINEKLSRIDQLLTSVDEDGDEALSEIIQLLGDEDKGKLLDLSTLDLWEIPEIPDGCGDDFDDDDEEEEEDDEEEEEGLLVEDEALVPSVVGGDRLSAWEKDLRSLVDSSTNEIMENSDLEDQVRKWIRSDLENEIGWKRILARFTTKELAKLIKKAESKSTFRPGDPLPTEAILKQIQDKLEIEIADRTGRFDYAAIHNGAAVIREGPRYTSPSLRRTLPYFNRLMAQLGLRFYGNEAEAALTPTVPQDALGQCWAFQSDEAIAIKRRIPKSAQDYSRGTVATLTVRLAKPTFVHSIVIEHPPKEISDRMKSAIRIFRVTGYEDSFGKKGAYELGRFEYKIDGDPVMEVPVARELSRDKVPRLQSVALAIESTWGGSIDFGCLYRFRVHGDVNE